MKILNLYAGIGANRHLWTDHSITNVEINAQCCAHLSSTYRDDTVVNEDAVEFLLANYNDFDFIWLSPPCQSHTKLTHSFNKRCPRLPDFTLYAIHTFLSSFHKGLFVIENVIPYYKPLIAPSASIGRHALWANFTIPFLKFNNPKGFASMSTESDFQSLVSWLGIPRPPHIYPGKAHNPCQLLRNATHPAIGNHILNAAIAHHNYPLTLW
jgi:DNA (cytosine-5)-methyltransferase 1